MKYTFHFSLQLLFKTFFPPVNIKKGTLKITHVCIHISACHNCPVLTKTGMGQQILVTIPNIKIHETLLRDC
jgi:hypothetical protein